MGMATSSVEFSFNDIMHCQIDGVTLGSPLGPALANIFVGYSKSKLYQTTSKPEMYYRFMDDTFAVFTYKDAGGLFLDSLNSFHHFLHFNFEKESNLALSFLNVLVEKSSFKFITSIHWKPTFTGQYLRWNSFSSQKRKTNLILTLKGHSSQVFTLNQNVGISLKCILTNSEVSTLCCFQDTAVQK